MLILWLILLFSCFRSNLLLAQEESDIIEPDIALPKTILIQQTLEDLTKNPIDINSADYDDLLKILYLTPILAYRIIETRKNNFQSVADLLKIPGIDKELYEQIRPFITIKPTKVKTSAKIRWQISLDSLTNIDQSDKYDITSRLLLLSSYKDINLRLNLLFDKDRQAPSWSNISTSVTTKHNKFVLGNYLLNFGSQLLFTGPYSYINSSKNFSFDPLRQISEANGVYKHSALFGIAYSQSLSQFNLYTYLSSTALDAEIKNQSVKKVYYYTKYNDSISQARRNQLSENLAGMRITYSPILNNDRYIVIGATGYHNHYDKPFAPTDSQNSFYGSDLNLIGIDVQTKYNNYFFKTELGHSIRNGLGGAMQIIGDWNFFKVNFNLYAQQKNFFSPHSRWKELTNRKDKITGSFNMFYNLSGFKMYFLASTRQDFTTDSLPSRIQYSLERKQDKFQFGLTLKGNYRETELKTYGTRFDLSYRINSNLSCYTRLEDRYVKGTEKSGRLLSAGLKFTKQYFSFDTRFYYFDISAYDCKIYYYESFKGTYGFLGQGTRVFTQIRVNNQKLLEFKYYLGYTRTNQENIDTGLELSIFVR